MGLDPITAAVGGSLILGQVSASKKAKKKRAALRAGTATVREASFESERLQLETINENVDFITKAFDEALKENRVTAQETEGIIADFALLSLADQSLSKEDSQKFFRNFKTSVGDRNVSERFASILEQGSAGEFERTTERLKPLFDFKRQRAQEALDKQLAARRGTSSGAALKAITRLQANQAADEASLLLGEQVRSENARRSLLAGAGADLSRTRAQFGTQGIGLGLGREQALSTLRQDQANVQSQGLLQRAQNDAAQTIGLSQLQGPSALDFGASVLQSFSGGADLSSLLTPRQQNTIPQQQQQPPLLQGPPAPPGLLSPPGTQFDPRAINRGFNNPFLRRQA